MKVRVSGLSVIALAAVAAAVGCSNNASNAIAPIKTGATPVPSTVPASPTPTGSSVPATATPTPRPSSVPATPTPTPAPGGTGNTVCTAPTVTGGTFTSIDTAGVVTGNTYADDGQGQWEAIAYSSPTPTPTPTVTATPVPSPTPTVTITPTPVPTPTPLMATIYYGEYTVSSYSGNALGGGSYTAGATNGCFFMILEQPVGGTLGQSHFRRAGPATPAPNAFGDGEPNEPGTEAETFLDEGTLTSLTITNLTPTSGSGSFSFTNSATNTATGAITITGSDTFTTSPDYRRIEALRSARGLLIRARVR